jgi:amino acid permease
VCFFLSYGSPEFESNCESVSAGAAAPIMAELQNCTIRRVDAVITVSLIVCTAIFVVTAICGYMYYGQNVDPDLLQDFPNAWASTLGATDYHQITLWRRAPRF